MTAHQNDERRRGSGGVQVSETETSIPAEGSAAQLAAEPWTRDCGERMLTRLRHPAPRNWVGCPCGCASRPGAVVDSDCARFATRLTEEKYDATGVFLGSGRMVALAELRAIAA